MEMWGDAGSRHCRNGTESCKSGLRSSNFMMGSTSPFWCWSRNMYLLSVPGSSTAIVKNLYKNMSFNLFNGDGSHYTHHLSVENDDKSQSLWRHQMETFSALLAICAGNSPVTGEFPTQRPVTRSFDVYFDLCPNERLSKQSWGWWFETLSRSLWRHRNVVFLF